MTLVKPSGMVGLLTPSGIASDKTAAPFFKGVSTGGRLKALYDFENRPHPATQSSFPTWTAASSSVCSLQARRHYQSLRDAHSFSKTYPSLRTPNVASRLPRGFCARQSEHRDRTDFSHKARRGADDGDLWPPARSGRSLDRRGGQDVAGQTTATMFHMTNDSNLFRTRQELEEQEGAYPIGGNRFRSAAGDWVPLYLAGWSSQFRSSRRRASW